MKKYISAINSSEFIKGPYTEKSVLIVPGDHFGLGHQFRISFGLHYDYLTTALDRIAELIKEVNQCQNV